MRNTIITVKDDAEYSRYLQPTESYNGLDCYGSVKTVVVPRRNRRKLLVRIIIVIATVCAVTRDAIVVVTTVSCLRNTNIVITIGTENEFENIIDAR